MQWVYMNHHSKWREIHKNSEREGEGIEIIKPIQPLDLHLDDRLEVNLLTTLNPRSANL